MIESIYSYMKIGLVHFMAYPSTMTGEGPILETILKTAADSYFNAIEITRIKDAKAREKVFKALSSSHMAVAFAAQPMLLTTGLNANDTDEAGRLAAASLLKEGIDEAYEMGASGFAFLSGRYGGGGKEEAFRALVKTTSELCAYAKAKGDITVALEIFDWNIDKKSLVGPVDLAKRYAETIRAEFDNFGLMVDLSHLPLIGETAEQAILPIKDYIVHAHIGNCVVKDAGLPAYGDAHPRFGFPGGENDVAAVAEFLAVLMRAGFLNKANPPVVSFEVKPFGDEDPDIVIANAKRTLNEAWARM
jgi:sugar phosphate isomerase/epimerase